MSYKGIVWSKQALENRAKSLRGLKRTPKQCEHFRQVALALHRKMSKGSVAQRTETRRKNGWNKNPDETKRRQSLNNARALLGKPVSIETRLKRAESLKGEKNHQWKGGITPLNERIRKRFECKLWRKSVFERDNFTCQKYGTNQSGTLIAHHINNFAEFPELRFAVDNGITLSKKSHDEFHKKYGYRNNTRKQLEEFLINSK